MSWNILIICQQTFKQSLTFNVNIFNYNLYSKNDCKNDYENEFKKK